MESRHLHYFLVVAEELSFTHAAKKLNMAQPPLSVQIKRLETEIGVPLFTRTKRRVELTEAGKAFLAETRRVLSIVDRSVVMARDIGMGRRGILRLGAVATTIYSVVPSILRVFGKMYPDISIELSEMTVPQQIEALNNGDIDVGILRTSIHAKDIETCRLYKEHIVGPVPSDHQPGRLRARRVRAA